MSYVFEPVLLRPLSIEDKEHTKRWRNDPETRSCVFGFRFPVTDEMECRWFEEVLAGENKSRLIYAIDSLATKELVGIVRLYDIDWISRTACLGIIVGDAENRSLGYGRAAVLGLLEIAKIYFNIRKISLDVLDHPKGSADFYLKLGFEVEGIFKEQYFLQHKYYDIIRMAIFL